MTDARLKTSRALVSGLYLLAALLVFQPLAEWLMAVWPPRPGTASWRYGAVGVLSGSLLTPILGVVVAGAVAVWRRHHTALRALGATALGVGVILLVSGAVLVLDAFKLQVQVPQEGQTRYALESGRSFFRVVSAAAVLLVLGVGGWRSVPRTATREKGTPTVLISTGEADTR